jgi:hypothetical protein
VGIDAAAADDVAARRRNGRRAEACKQWARQQDRCPDLVAELLVKLRRRHPRRVDTDVVRAYPVGLRARTAKERQHRVHVEDARDVGELDRLRGEHAGGENRQRGVLVAGGLHVPGERMPSFDHERLSQGVGDDGLHGDGTLPAHDSDPRSGLGDADAVHEGERCCGTRSP